MKYQAIIETDEFENFEFFEDGNGKYMVGYDAGATSGGWIPLHFTEYKQENILNKIRTEIEKAIWEDILINFNGTDETRIPRLDPDDVFEIIDKYKTESEEE